MVITTAAPTAVLELMKCKGICDPEKRLCCDVRNKLSCTALCECSDFPNRSDYKLSGEEEDKEETI